MENVFARKVSRRSFMKGSAAAAAVMSMGLPTLAASAAATHEATLYAHVTDSGEIVNKMVIDFGESLKVTGVDAATFTVHATGSTADHRAEGVMSYGDYDADRQIIRAETDGRYVTLYFYEGDGAGSTLAYLSSARNYPVTLSYTITQNSPLTATALDGRAISYTAAYTWNGKVVDEETAKFASVKVENGINYQFYNAGEGADSLIVWFHGNGEGDDAGSQNNVSQMLANRGTVAWATDEAQATFGSSYVMAFQAPDTWYYAQRDGLLAKAEAEIQAVISQYGIDPEKVYVSGCSAGGYMTTRMLIAYPGLFKAAMINCPALDVAQLRGGETPTDEELASIKDSDTGIWLVQGVTDASVRREDCSQRLFDILTEGKKLTESIHDQDLESDYTTWETSDGKYKLSLYETVNQANAVDSFGVTRPSGKIKIADDPDQDGVYETVLKSDHWTWIYTLNNNPTDSDGTTIWEWAADYEPKSSLLGGVRKFINSLKK